MPGTRRAWKTATGDDRTVESTKLGQSRESVRRPFSLIGYSVDDPLDDRIESLLIESVSAIDANLGDEITGDLGRDLICIP